MNVFEEDWKEYKRARNTFLLLFVLYVPVCFGIVVASMKLFHTVTPGVRRSLPMDGYASGERHASQSLALPELRGVVFGNVVV